MIRDISRITKNKFDLLVVGGGINGAAIAHLAAAAGTSVALLEKGDFASGTSSKSTKLLHGGIRYLENFEFDLVYESLHERHLQLSAAPHLARPLGFVVPVYKGDPRPLWMMRLGVWLYDVLSGTQKVGQHRMLSVNEIRELAPGIQLDGLRGGVEYFDVQMDDARIVLENALMADEYGGVAANYVVVEDFIKDHAGRATGVAARDELSGQKLEVMAAKIIVAAGPWSDQLIQKDVPSAVRRLRPTKGVHIVYRGEISKHAFLLQSRHDRRIFFVTPFKGNTLIGTTDTDESNPDEVKPQEADIQYLLREASRVFPNIDFDPKHIITSFAGLRPLVAEAGHPSQISRKHTIDKNASGIYFVMGGKYTTYRAIAEDALAKAMPGLKVPHASQFRLYGSGAANEEIKILSDRHGVSIDLIKYLQSIYGSRFKEVLAIALKDPRWKIPICPCSQAIAAQAIYARDVEMALTPQDILERRLQFSYLDCPSGDHVRKIEELFRS